MFFLQYAEAKLVHALNSKQEDSGFDSRWCHWNFSFTKSRRPQHGLRIDIVTARNEYRNIFWM